MQSKKLSLFRPENMTKIKKSNKVKRTNNQSSKVNF